eukprot:9758263-Lingulodinium_polyedra.AAC.1
MAGAPRRGAPPWQREIVENGGRRPPTPGATRVCAPPTCPASRAGCASPTRQQDAAAARTPPPS